MPGVIILSTMMAALLMLAQVSQFSTAKTMLITDPSQTMEYPLMGKYQMFVKHSAAYMKANPTFSGTLTWATIKSMAPAAGQNAEMPATWKVVADGTNYVICTEFPSQRAATVPSQFIEDKPVKLVRLASGNVVVGDPAAGAVALGLEEAKCL